jgi:hypothetical protein
MNYLDECAAFIGSDTRNEASEQGTFLHDLMEKMLKQVIAGKSKTTLEQVNTWVTRTHELADDEVEYLRICCHRVDLYLSKKPSKIVTELKVKVFNPDGSEFNSGYLDVLYLFADETVGIMQDFKFGWEPVRPPETNLQGMNYVLGCFQKFPKLQRIGVEFVQPKLSASPEGRTFERTSAQTIYDRLTEIVARAKFVTDVVGAETEKSVQQYMKPGNYCKYCARSANCAVLANMRATAATKFAGLPQPRSFKGLELKTPEDIALARYWVELFEAGAEEIKKRAYEVAEQTGGPLTATLPNGEEITYDMAERSVDRSLGSAVEVAEALKEVITPEEVLGAAELSIGKLEKLVKQAMVEAAQAAGEKLTKKAAWERISSTLEAMGLLSRPDKKIRYLKLRKTTKQISDAR